MDGVSLCRVRREYFDLKIGQWGLVICNGPSFVWSFTPKIDPGFAIPGQRDLELDIDFESEIENDLYIDFSNEFGMLNIRDGYNFYKSALERGFDPKVHFHWFDWFNNHLATIITTIPPEIEDDGFPHCDQHYLHDYESDDIKDFTRTYPALLVKKEEE